MALPKGDHIGGRKSMGKAGQKKAADKARLKRTATAATAAATTKNQPGSLYMKASGFAQRSIKSAIKRPAKKGGKGK